MFDAIGAASASALHWTIIGPVTIPMDSSRAVRSPAQQQGIVQSIVDAPGSEQETGYIEWKSDVDLGQKDWQATSARHILGFANRHPDEAARSFEGCAYLVLGASPGKLSGTTVHDIAKLNAWLSAYVGDAPDAPQWSATYVSIGGVQVLLVTIERPRWGDPIWTFQKEYTPPSSRSPMRAGSIFIRRRGSTEQANPAEVRMLSERAGSGPRRLGLSLELPEGDEAIAVETGVDAVEAWASAERTALEPPPPARSAPPLGASRAGSSDERRAALLAATTAALKSSRALDEPRSREAFAAEIDAYISKAQDALPAGMMRGVVRRKLGRINLWLVNETEHNFRQVAVELHFAEAGVSAYFDEEDVEGPFLPSRPEPWGTRSAVGLFGFRDLRSSVRIPSLSTRILPPSPRGHVDNSASSRIHFVPVDVRPGYQHRLDAFHLMTAPEHAGGSVDGTWVATATDTSGIARGTLRVPVRDEPADLEVLLAPLSRRQDEDD